MSEQEGQVVVAWRSIGSLTASGWPWPDVGIRFPQNVSLELALCKLIRPDHWMTTLVHPMENKKIVHGAERLMLWRAGDDWTRPFGPLDGPTGSGEFEG